MTDISVCHMAVNGLFRFGQFCFRTIEEKEELCNSSWFQYREDCIQKIDASFQIERSDLLHAISMYGGNGWNHFLVDGMHYVIYAENGVNSFLFTYSSNEEPSYAVSIPKGQLRRNLLTAIQFAMLFCLADRAIGVHGVTVICEDKVIILSAPSGTGKSTLGNLLHTYCGAAVVNGDFALLSLDEEGNLLFEPTPFCGTSGRCANYRLRVDRIVFLEQAFDNKFRDLNAREAYTRMLSNSFVPDWDIERRGLIQESIMKAVAAVPMSVFAFAPTQEAAEMFHSLVT